MPIAFETADRLLAYEPVSGELRWKRRPAHLFASASSAARWNTRYAGKRVGCLNGEDYLVMSLFDRRYLVHRVIWLLSTGDWPVGQIDHDNHDRSDNRATNLHCVTHGQNGRNQRLRINNTSGHNGVRRRADSPKWIAEASTDGRSQCLGRFSRLEDAIAAHQAFDRQNDFHPNHGASQ